MDFEEYVQANYKRLEGQTRELVEDAFKAGQQSKQAEIDGLEKKLKYEKLAYKNIKLQFLNKQHDLDELQAEIDALKAKVQELWTELDDRQSKEHIIEKCETIIQEILK